MLQGTGIGVSNEAASTNCKSLSNPAGASSGVEPDGPSQVKPTERVTCSDELGKAQTKIDCGDVGTEKPGVPASASPPPDCSTGATDPTFKSDALPTEQGQRNRRGAPSPPLEASAPMPGAAPIEGQRDLIDVIRPGHAK